MVGSLRSEVDVRMEEAGPGDSGHVCNWEETSTNERCIDRWKGKSQRSGVSPGVGTSSKSRAALGDKATSSTVDPGVWYPVLSKEAGASPSNQATNP